MTRCLLVIIISMGNCVSEKVMHRHTNTRTMIQAKHYGYIKFELVHMSIFQGFDLVLQSRVKENREKEKERKEHSWYNYAYRYKIVLCE